MSETSGSEEWSGSPGDTTAALAVLGDESRRRLFEYVRRAGRPVTRDEASAAVGISRKLAGFHLDKLVAAGLLRTGHAHRGARRVGRAAKVYEPSPRTLRMSLPPRRHELLSSLLSEAVTAHRPDESAREAAVRLARERGEELGAEARGADLIAFLRSLGFEPADAGGGRTVLHTCPFHPSSAHSAHLVCGMSHAFLRGCLASSGHDRTTTAVLAPRPGRCCVELRTTDRPDGAPDTVGPAPDADDPPCARDLRP
ncbi:helix-turn-helix transcriptional regulator [Streptomyces thermocoprophilus]|uniref:Helix-turn-helix transcriptional regulator n=1 Tax=Streptomyces thermocoprophilus TaxID=78356 RepID=A0ABV5V8V7_9ACTN